MINPNKSKIIILRHFLAFLRLVARILAHPVSFGPFFSKIKAATVKLSIEIDST